MIDEELIDDIAFNAGCYKHKYCNPAHPDLEGWIINQDSLERFASLIIAEEREACAKTAEERDAIVKDSDTAYMLLRQSLEALEAVLSDDKPYIKQCKDLKSSIETFLN